MKEEENKDLLFSMFKQDNRGGGNTNPPLLSVVIPCYNEEEVILTTHQALQKKLQQLFEEKLISKNSYLLYIDDGSSDNTYKILETIAKSSKYPFKTKVLKLSKNFGHQNALLAGYIVASKKCDCAISIDCDLQDDIEVFNHFMQKFIEGKEVIFGVRKDRVTDSIFKRKSANLFYKLMRIMVGKKYSIIDNHADYRLLSHRALLELKNFGECNLFLRGIVPLLGFKQDIVYYSRNKRIAGISKYPLKKMLTFAWDGITSFSIAPLHFITLSGAIFLILSIIATFYVFYLNFFTNTTIRGWASIAILILFFGGFLTFAIGILGEYIGKIYNEVKRRPKFIIEELINDNE